MHIRSWWENLMKTDHLEDPVANLGIKNGS
jgi:hypothetical protein